MTPDLDQHLTATDREVGSRPVDGGTGAEARTVRIRRRYAAPIDDVWDACTDPERLARWFAPVSGDLRLGGSYQIEGNAGGEIVRCEKPSLLKVTWIYGQDPDDADLSEVEVRLTPADDGGTVLELEHVAVVDPDFWSRFGPGAVGVGWDLGLLGLAIHLAGGHIEDKEAWGATPEALAFMRGCSERWGAAHAASGATPEDATAAATATADFYAPAPADEAGVAGPA